MSRLTGVILLLTVFFVNDVSADELNIVPTGGAHMLGTAVSGGMNPAFDHKLKGDLDKLIPKLKQLDLNDVVLIEVYYPGKSGVSNGQRTADAFSLAEQVQQYLKSRQNRDRAFYIALWDDLADKSNLPKVRLKKYPREYFEN